MDLIAELDLLRRDARAVAQRKYVEALVSGDVDLAVVLLPASQHGTLERVILEELDLLERFEAITASAEEASREAQAERAEERAPVYDRVAEKQAAQEEPS